MNCGVQKNMNQISIRKAVAADASIITKFIRFMLEEMESMDGHQIIDKDSEWETVENELKKRIDDKDCIILFAEINAPPLEHIGFVEAQIFNFGFVFKPKKTLHIRSVYVSPSHRRKGIAMKLLKAVLEWGKKVGCIEADLNILVSNPAYALYEKLGFKKFEIKMLKKL